MIKITPKSIAAILIGIAIGFWLMTMMSCTPIGHTVKGTVTSIRGNLVELNTKDKFLINCPDSLKVGDTVKFKPSRFWAKANCISLK